MQQLLLRVPLQIRELWPVKVLVLAQLSFRHCLVSRLFHHFPPVLSHPQARIRLHRAVRTLVHLLVLRKQQEISTLLQLLLQVRLERWPVRALLLRNLLLRHCLVFRLFLHWPPVLSHPQFRIQLLRAIRSFLHRLKEQSRASLRVQGPSIFKAQMQQGQILRAQFLLR